VRLERRSVGVAVAGSVTFLNLYNVQTLLPTLAAAFQVPLPRTGLTVTATLIAVAVVAPVIGSVSDMVGRKWLVVGASWVLTVPTLLAAAATSLDQLILCRFAQGLLLPFIFAVTVAYISDEAPGAEGIRLAGTYSVGTILGGFGGRLLAGYAAELAGWRSSFLLLAGLTAIGAFIVGITLPPERHFRPVRGWGRLLGNFTGHLTNPQLLATYALGFGVLFTIVAAFTYASFVLAGPPYRLGPGALGSIFVVYLTGMISTPLATRFAVRHGRRLTLGLAVVATVAGLVLCLVRNLWAMLAGLGAVAGAVLVEQALALGYVGAAAPGGRSVAVGLYVTAYYLGGSVGGVLPGAIWNLVGWPGCVGLSVGVQAIMAAVAARWWREPAHRIPG
jgi:MFS transporter, YNFM family, putative membrane transport protein